MLKQGFSRQYGLYARFREIIDGTGKGKGELTLPSFLPTMSVASVLLVYLSLVGAGRITNKLSILSLVRLLVCCLFRTSVDTQALSHWDTRTGGTIMCGEEDVMRDQMHALPRRGTQTKGKLTCLLTSL